MAVAVSEMVMRMVTVTVTAGGVTVIAGGVTVIAGRVTVIAGRVTIGRQVGTVTIGRGAGAAATTLVCISRHPSRIIIQSSR